jgi:hypothetical protein
MNPSLFRLPELWFYFCLVLICADGLWAAEPRVQILSPKEGSHITQDQNSVLVSGKVATDIGRSPNVDILFVIDTSGSTSQYAGADFGDLSQLPDNSGSFGFGRPQISIGGFGMGQPPQRNLRNSILAAEVGAARRLLLQLNSQTTRIGIVTFGEGAKVLQPLTHDFEQVRRSLDDILRAGPYGGTNMAEGIRAGITEHEAWTGTDPTPRTAARGTSIIPIKTKFPVQKVKLFFDSPAVAGWNEIDAVGLRSKDDNVQWAMKVTASSTYAQQVEPVPVNVIVPAGQFQRLQQEVNDLKKELERMKQMEADLKELKDLVKSLKDDK